MLPAVSAFVIVVAGVGMVARAVPESEGLMFGLDSWLVHFSDGDDPADRVAVAVLLGLRHATDPDHLAAVTTLVTNGRGGATRLGLTWGLGHASSLLVLGVPIVIWKAYLPPRVEQSAEVTIGFVIIALALWLLLRWRRGAFAHDHAHLRVPPQRTPWQAYGIGLVHGIGGSGGVGVLLLAAIHSHVRRARRARPLRRLHRDLDGDALDGVRLRARPPADAARVRPGRAGVRSDRGLLRRLVRARGTRARAVRLLIELGRKPIGLRGRRCRPRSHSSQTRTSLRVSRGRTRARWPSSTTASAASPTGSPTGSCGTQALAQDAVQDAFLAVWRTAVSFDSDRGKASTWLLTLVHRRAVDVVRREDRRRGRAPR